MASRSRSATSSRAEASGRRAEGVPRRAASSTMSWRSSRHPSVSGVPGTARGWAVPGRGRAGSPDPPPTSRGSRPGRTRWHATVYRPVRGPRGRSHPRTRWCGRDDRLEVGGRRRDRGPDDRASRQGSGRCRSSTGRAGRGRRAGPRPRSSMRRARSSVVHRRSACSSAAPSAVSAIRVAPVIVRVGCARDGAPPYRTSTSREAVGALVPRMSASPPIRTRPRRLESCTAPSRELGGRCAASGWACTSLRPNRALASPQPV